MITKKTALEAKNCVDKVRVTKSQAELDLAKNIKIQKILQPCE